LILNTRKAAIERKKRLLPVPAQRGAEKRGVMPIINPTGNPFLLNKMKVPSDKEALSKL